MTNTQSVPRLNTQPYGNIAGDGVAGSRYSLSHLSSRSWPQLFAISGNFLNQCQYVYNDFGQLVTEYQSHVGTVKPSTTPRVGYTFPDGSTNTIRPTGLVDLAGLNGLDPNTGDSDGHPSGKPK